MTDGAPDNAPDPAPAPGGPPPRSVPAAGLALLWLAAAALVAFLLWWPVHARVTLANDGWVYGYLADVPGSFSNGIREMWSRRDFRPVDLLGGVLTEPLTADARWTMVLQAVGLLALITAVAVAVRRLLPRSRAALPLTVIWLALHTSTSISLWMPHAISQTWSAAFGAWLGLALWWALDALFAEKPLGPHALLLTVLCALGVFTKETFHGWCAGALLVMGVCLVVSWWRGRRTPLGRWVLLALPLAIIPLVHFGLRFELGGLGEVVTAEEGRYRVVAGLNILQNLFLSAVLFFAVVPAHLTQQRNAPLWLVTIPVVGIVLSVVTCALPWLWQTLGTRTWDDRPRPDLVALAAIFAFCGVSATLPTPHVSELYMMGPNVGGAILFTIGLFGLWSLTHGTDGRPRWIPSVLVTALAGCVLAIGVFGLVARAEHFRITWIYAAELRRAVVAYQAALPASEKVNRVYLYDACGVGRRHSQYLMPPHRALNMGRTEQWLSERDPARRLQIRLTGTRLLLEPGDLYLDCADLPRRPRW